MQGFQPISDRMVQGQGRHQVLCFLPSFIPRRVDAGAQHSKSNCHVFAKEGRREDIRVVEKEAQWAWFPRWTISTLFIGSPVFARQLSRARLFCVPAARPPGPPRGNFPAILFFPSPNSQSLGIPSFAGTPRRGPRVSPRLAVPVTPAFPSAPLRRCVLSAQSGLVPTCRGCAWLQQRLGRWGRVTWRVLEGRVVRILGRETGMGAKKGDMVAGTDMDTPPSAVRHARWWHSVAF
ncbi:hypothetical protein B0J18DRAFT_217066 [Chaetomium sp. MPI-SDFR-AT-0129]|nr:hypothetical protein B0J18DRAFT_217066 [Chaetomium sp. MPI-SDFR-AT-0129]